MRQIRFKEVEKLVKNVNYDVNLDILYFKDQIFSHYATLNSTI